MYRGVALVVALLALAVPSAIAAPDFVIVGDTSIGGFPRDGKVKRAIEVFGQPGSRLQEGYDTCKLSWPSYGITMVSYYALAQQDPCGPTAKHRSTTVTDRRWRTAKRLKMGDPLKRLRTLYPKAVKTAPGRWELKTRMLAGLPFPGLEATIRNGRVVAFTVHGPRSGF